MTRIKGVKKLKRFNPAILACPQCRKRFRRLRDLNAHLLVRHEAPYHVVLPKTPTGVAHACPRKGQCAHS